MTLDQHSPHNRCDCPECRAYFDFRKHQAFMNAAARKRLDDMPLLTRMRAEDRPHLRDLAFLKFMGKVVGNTLKPNL
jgi:hypothetical protein